MSRDGEGITTGRAWHEWCDRLKGHNNQPYSDETIESIEAAYRGIGDALEMLADIRSNRP